MVGVAPHFEFLSLRMMLFLVPTFFLVFSICALYDNVRSTVTPRYTGRLQWVKFIPFQLMLSCLPHSRFRRWKRLTCVFVGFARSWFVVQYSDRPSRAEVSVSSIGAKSMLGVVTARSSVYTKLRVPRCIGWSFVCMITRSGASTLPCGRLFLCDSFPSEFHEETTVLQ